MDGLSGLCCVIDDTYLRFAFTFFSFPTLFCMENMYVCMYVEGVVAILCLAYVDTIA